ncbi:MAG: hypothetical protein AB1722_03745 [Pseudomonadota bacterium]
MLTRAALFVTALLILPPLSLTVAELEWLPPPVLSGAVWLPAAITLGMLAMAMLMFDALAARRSGVRLLHSQRGYLAWCAVAGALLGALSGWLNLFAGLWVSAAATPGAAILLAALCGALALPTVLLARLWLAGLPGLARLNRVGLTLPALPGEATARVLLLLALGSLSAGVAWPGFPAALFWSAPLWLLVALQLLWHEGTLFAGLPRGDWSRVLHGMLAGLLVGGLLLSAWRLASGALHLNGAPWQIALACALYGLTALQLGDLVAEHWRGKPRSEVFKRKPFPIPVVSKKDQ